VRTLTIIGARHVFVGCAPSQKAGIFVGMKILPLWLPAAGIVCIFAGVASAQSSGMPPMEGMEPVPPPDQLPVPIQMTGIGNSHIAIKATPEAQAWFDQGLSLLNDFWEYESAKAFEQAIRTDPNCAMCYWGLAQAVQFRGPEEKVYGDKALDQAKRLASKASKTDKLFIAAADTESKEEGKDHSASIAIYRQLVKKEPKDVEARIYLANAVGDGFDDDGNPKPGEKEKIAILEGVLKDAPNDSAANHYWIHAMEPSNHPERAIPSAALLASLAPNSGHMVHMPGHIYYRVGDYASADHWFAASTETDERYMRQQHVDVDNDWNYVHNMMYGIANLMEQGRLNDANALSDRLAGAHGHLAASLYIWSARDQITRLSLRLPVELRTGDWKTVLAMLDDAKIAESENTVHLRFLREEMRSFATGMNALDEGDVATAQSASERMDAGLWREQQETKADADKKADEQEAEVKAKKTDDAKPPTMPLNPDAEAEPLMTALNIASMELRAGLMLGQGKSAEAKKLYAQAVTTEKKLGYREPPFYIRPVAETEAEALMRARDYQGAKAAYQAALLERPASGFELFGIAHADELAGNKAAAQSEYQAFLKAWPTADASLPQMVRARRVLGDAPSTAAR
jgi:tetratricopeptide (TPR) repeat protein